MASLHDWTTQDEISDINIVPLVDVLLVLLVIFMITAPIITQTLEVELPRASLAPGANPNQTLIVSVDARGNLAVNDTLLGPYDRAATVARFQQEIGQWQRRNPGSPAFLRADRRLVYGTVMQVMAQLRTMGVANVGLMIEREGR